MSTGYTSKIKDGITFKKFALDCARAFGALITMRDDPIDTEIPDEFKPLNYHTEQLAKDQINLDNLNSLDENAIEIAFQGEKLLMLASTAERLRETEDLKGKYQEMLKQVNLWTPPSADHEELKRFMQSQIEDSINFDCSTKYLLKNKEEFPKTAEEWKAKKIDDLSWSINYHTKENINEIERCAERTKWVKLLKESLKGVKNEQSR